MAIQRDASGKLHIESPFMGESMMDKYLLASTDMGPIHRLMPDLVVVKVGDRASSTAAARRFCRSWMSWWRPARNIRS